MRILRDLSIAKKLTLLAMLTAGVALLLASSGLVIHELTTYRDQAASSLSTLAQVMADNTSAALEFDVPGSAIDILAALKAEPQIVTACVYAPGGRLFAQYVRAGEGTGCRGAPGAEGSRFVGRHLMLSHPILHEGERIGSIELRSDLGGLRDRLEHYALVLALVLVASALVAFALSARLQQTVSEPILRLARAARTVSEKKDYSIRAPGAGQDEVGVLIDSFNEMLGEIQERDAALTTSIRRTEATQRSLVERSQQLEQVNVELEQQVRERMKAEDKIRELAYRDALTGLANRRLFQDRLRKALTNAERQQARPAVLYLDLDRFKLINDSYGHAFGDLVLQNVGSRLMECLRRADTIARVGGDEFTILLPDGGSNVDVVRMAARLLDSVREPLNLEGRELYVTSSLGIAIYPEDGRDVDTLVKNADAAMYRSKEQGRDCYELYAAGMSARVMDRLARENDLRKALHRKEFTLHYQPVLELDSGRVHGVEALLRWNHPGHGLIHPNEFVPVAEATGLIVPLGPWALHTACAQVKEWQSTLSQDLSVAVNLSARQFQHRDLANQIRAALDETQLEPRYLDLEITETCAMQNPEAATDTLAELKNIGVQVSIDDFGTGYSSLGYLKRLPIDTIKIDQSFVRDITNASEDAAIVTAVVEMAHSLSLKAVAEGVETSAQRAFLSERGCDRMQGFLFSEPLPSRECARLLEQAQLTAN